jgi:hypothetical protein
MMITNIPSVARSAVAAGVDRVFVDLEILGKVARQGHLNTVISRHRVEDVATIRETVPQAELLVRVNPLHEGSQQEVDTVLAAGADLLMLPMFATAETVAEFSGIVAGRAGIVPLVETAAAAADIDRVARVHGVHEVFIGLNDLHLSLRRRFMFELLADGTVEKLCRAVKNAGVPYGFGGVARLGEGMLPAELILGEHVRLGSRSVILSRTFFQDPSRSVHDPSFAEAVADLRTATVALKSRTAEEAERDRLNLITITNGIAAKIAKRVA